MGFCHATSLSRQRGSAIVFAMGISLLVVALSAALLLWLTLDIRRVKHLQDASQRIGALETAEAMAAEKITTLPDGWDMPWEMDRDGVKITAKLLDLSGRLNINTLFSQDSDNKQPEFFMPMAVLERLLASQSIDNPEKVLEQVMAENNILLGVNSLAELSPVKDFLFGASPENQLVNINTTTPEVLSSILDIPMPTAVALIAQRPYTSSEELNEAFKHLDLNFSAPSPIETWLTTDGSYYLLETTIKQHRTMRIYSVFHRDGNSLTLEWRSWGTLP